MKKLLALSLTIVLAAAVMAPAAFADGADYVAPFASTAPKIDGQIDDIWGSAAEIVPAEVHDDDSMCTGYVKILWAQDAMYFLEVAKDATIPSANESSANSFDLWISENNNQADGYDTDLGDYHICINSNGVKCPYTGNEDIYDVIEFAVANTSDGYAVEIRVPYVMLKPAAEGHVIGFNVSLNDDFDDDDGRDSYSTWMEQDGHEGFYWSSTYLNTVQFGEIPAETAAPETAAPAPAETAAPAPAEVAPAAETAAPVAAPAPAAAAPAAQTSDNISIAVIAVAAALGCAVVIGRRK